MRSIFFSDKVFISVALAILLPSLAFCQKQIALEDVSKHVGETVNICGKVYAASLLENVRGKPTLMNLGGDKANERVEIRIRFEELKNFSYNPEALFLYKRVCLTGRITKEHGYAEMIMDKYNSDKLLNEAYTLAKDTSFSAFVDTTKTHPTTKLKLIKIYTNAYLLTGPSLHESIITWLKVGSSVLVDYSTKGWSYVRVVENTSNPNNKSWLYGFVRNQALGLGKRRKI